MDYTNEIRQWFKDHPAKFYDPRDISVALPHIPIEDLTDSIMALIHNYDEYRACYAVVSPRTKNLVGCFERVNDIPDVMYDDSGAWFETGDAICIPIFVKNRTPLWIRQLLKFFGRKSETQ